MTSLLDLFDGRHDCWFDSYLLALVWAIEDAPDADWTIAFNAHAEGHGDIGVYPRRDDGLCKWGCVDIDTGDFSEALEVWRRLTDAGIGAWIEASGSWKDLNKRGYHVWVFSSDWIEATHMRAILVEVVHAAGLPEKTEINPKQVTATSKGVGNCVRLPYGKRSREYPGYSCMTFSPQGEFKDFTVEEFLEQVEPTDVWDLNLLGNNAIRRQSMRRAAREAAERLRRHEANTPPFGSAGASQGRGKDQRAWRILQGLDRAGDGERNLCAFVIACHLKGLGLNIDEARSRMTVAVERSFDGGAAFVDEAIETLNKVYRS